MRLAATLVVLWAVLGNLLLSGAHFHRSEALRRSQTARDRLAVDSSHHSHDCGTSDDSPGRIPAGDRDDCAVCRFLAHSFALPHAYVLELAGAVRTEVAILVPSTWVFFPGANYHVRGPPSAGRC